MQRYMIKEKMWSFTDSFQILDELGQPAFEVKGKAFSWGDNLCFQDMQGGELARISQKLMSFRPKYEIYRGGRLFAEVVKEFSWLKQTFTLDVPGPNDYTIKGSFWQHDYSFIRGGRVVASIGKALWTWTDTYGVELIDEEDAVSILCTAIVIDQVLHDEQNN